MKSLLSKFAQKQARIVIVGVGYVGLPLATAFAAAGFSTLGYDKNVRRVSAINDERRSYVADVQSIDLAVQVEAGRLSATSDPDVLRGADAIIVCVPTPLDELRQPDLRFIEEATREIARSLHPELLVVLESTTYPGTTREVLLPPLIRAGGRLGEDLFVAYSPERLEPGNPTWGIHNTPKVVGGVSPACSLVAQALYQRVIERTVAVSSVEVAEMVKLFENTFRAVNIGLANELAVMCRTLGLDVWEVIDAAATRPFGFMPFYPGPGVGGHCIPIDPLYLSWKLRTLKYQARFIELADTINSAMPEHVVHLVADALNERAKAVKGSRILVSGVAYKRDVADLRESPALEVIDLLRRRGAEVSYHDPFIAVLDEHGADTVPTLVGMKSVASPVKYGAYDAVVIVTDHTDLPYERMLAEAPCIVDTRNALKRFPSAQRGKVVTL